MVIRSLSPLTVVAVGVSSRLDERRLRQIIMRQNRSRDGGGAGPNGPDGTLGLDLSKNLGMWGDSVALGAVFEQGFGFMWRNLGFRGVYWYGGSPCPHQLGRRRNCPPGSGSKNALGYRSRCGRCRSEFLSQPNRSALVGTACGYDSRCKILSAHKV